MAAPVCLVTGAGRGLGTAIALAFARRGYDVAVHYHTSRDGAAAAKNDIEAMGRRSITLAADLTQSKEADALVNGTVDALGRLDVLVNNAGVARDTLLARMTDDDWQSALAGNLSAPFHTLRAAIPVMRRQGEGSVVNIASFLALRPARGAVNYAAAKAGLVALTKGAAVEEGAHGIRVNAVLPGFHPPDMNTALWQTHADVIRAQHMLKALPERAAMADFVATVAELKTVSGQVFPFESRLS